MAQQTSADHMQERADTSTTTLPNELQDGLSISSSLPPTDALVLETVDALRSQLAKSKSAIRDSLEMKHILLLLVKDFHDLCEQMAFEKNQWLQKIQETIGQAGSFATTPREQTGQIIVEKVHAAPWGLFKRPEQGRSDTVHTILAIYKAMVDFVRAVRAGLEQKAQQGVNLKQLEVDEMQSEEDEEAAKAPPPTTRPEIPKIIIHPPKPPPKSASTSPPSQKSASTSPPSLESAETSSTSRKSSFRGSGNFNHGLFTSWTIAEWVHLLKTYLDNPTEMGKDIAQMHNDGYWVPKGRNVKRSTDSVRQQYKKLMGKGTKEQTICKIPEKIAELEDGKNEDAEDEEDVE